MKTFQQLILSTLIFISMTGFKINPIIEANYEVIPLPQNIIKTGNEKFTLNENTVIVFTKGKEIKHKNKQRNFLPNT